MAETLHPKHARNMARVAHRLAEAIMRSLNVHPYLGNGAPWALMRLASQDVRQQIADAAGYEGEVTDHTWAVAVEDAEWAWNRERKV